MSVWQTMWIALRSLLVHPLRSFLAILGIVIGVAAVILMTAMGAGAQDRVQKSVFSMGTNLLYVVPGYRGSGSSRSRSTTTTTLELDDAEAVRRLPMVREVSPEFSRGFQIKFANRNTSASVDGVQPQYEEVRNYRAGRGRFFNRYDEVGRKRVCALGVEIVDDLFGAVEPVGKWVKIDRKNFLVVGVMEKKGAQGWTNPDNNVYVPLSTSMFRLSRVNYLGRITVAVDSMDRMMEAQDAIEALLRRRHRTPADEESDFHIYNQTEWLQRYTEMAGTFGALLAGIASVSLLVGGIGIMNIMLVSVTERTREIGIRKAIGARRADVLRQFLIESATISLVGGALGVALALVGGPVVQGLSLWEKLAQSQPGGGAWELIFSPEIIALAFVFSAAVGIFFGIYPAVKASRLSPVEALRYE